MKNVAGIPVAAAVEFVRIVKGVYAPYFETHPLTDDQILEAIGTSWDPEERSIETFPETAYPGFEEFYGQDAIENEYVWTWFCPVWDGSKWMNNSPDTTPWNPPAQLPGQENKRK